MNQDIACGDREFLSMGVGDADNSNRIRFTGVGRASKDEGGVVEGANEKGERGGEDLI